RTRPARQPQENSMTTRCLSLLLLALSVRVALPPTTGSAEAATRRGPRICTAELVAQLREALASECPCAGSRAAGGATVPGSKRRLYQSCTRKVTHVFMRASRRTLQRSCLKDTLRCTARSTCGVDGAVTCSVEASGSCVSKCTGQPTLTCMADGDCSGTCQP